MVSTGLAESGGVATVETNHVVAATRVILASETLGRLLAPESGPLAGASFHLYLFDEQRELLLPAFEGRPSPSRGWKVGTGAVGEAWASAEYVLVRGAEVSDDTYGLTPAQQRRARDLAVVAAMPVTNASDEVIAVLAGSSVDADSALGTGEAFDAQLLMAQEVARVLVDLLRWFPDRYARYVERQGEAMGTGCERHEVTPVSADDVARVVSRALAERTSPIRLTSGQRLAILNRPLRPRPARA